MTLLKMGADDRATQRRDAWVARGVALAVSAVIVGCATCAPHQRVAIDSAPRDATVFLDGETVGSSPLELDLRADRDHSVFLKRDGYRPELVILRSLAGEQRPRLDPGEVRVRLVPLERNRDLDVEMDEPLEEDVPRDPAWQSNPTPEGSPGGRP